MKLRKEDRERGKARILHRAVNKYYAISNKAYS
jgi:hypothetical protein